ncbi:MAG TPA: hypothetical protein VE422_10225 [Terriglobia bacterium]|nr:hypothetical protein [Terriglobia bacterium]
MKVNFEPRRVAKRMMLNLAMITALAASVPSAFSQAFTAEDLGMVRTPVGAINNQTGQALAVVLNRDGEVVVHGFRPNCRPETSLPVSENALGVAMGSSTQVAGTNGSFRTTIGADPCAFLDDAAPIAPLPTPTTFQLFGTQPKSMNGGDVVVGSGSAMVSPSASLRDLPIRWAATAGFTPTILQTGTDILGFPKAGAALDINDSGAVVGSVGSGSEKRAVIFRDNQDPLTLSPSTKSVSLTEATGISNSGLITGNGRFLVSAGTATVFQNRAFVRRLVWGVSAIARTELPEMWYLDNSVPQPIYTQSVAHRINNSGNAVGYIVSPLIPKTAALWDQLGNIYDIFQNTEDLNGIILSEAVDINDHGIILAFGKRSGETDLHAILLRPTGRPLAAYTGQTY